jgi:hypothetical protein
MTNSHRPDGNGTVEGTTKNVIDMVEQIASKKNDKIHSSSKSKESKAVQNSDLLASNHDHTTTNNKDNTEIKSNRFPTFGTRFPFPETTTVSPAPETSPVDVKELEKKLLDVLDRLALSYKNSSDID